MEVDLKASIWFSGAAIRSML